MIYDLKWGIKYFIEKYILFKWIFQRTVRDSKVRWYTSWKSKFNSKLPIYFTGAIFNRCLTSCHIEQGDCDVTTPEVNKHTSNGWTRLGECYVVQNLDLNEHSRVQNGKLFNRIIDHLKRLQEHFCAFGTRWAD